jgi:hypothetical protein
MRSTTLDVSIFATGAVVGFVAGFVVFGLLLV